MNIQHLRYAVEVAHTGSISQAAENLFMGQPNLSKAIKELEENIGVSLFNRSPKGVTPTTKGAEFLQHARSILVQIDEMERLYKSEHTEKQSISIGVPRSSYIAGAFTDFVNQLNRDKDIEVRFQETNSMLVMHNVADNINNIGIIRYQTEHETYFTNFLKNKNLQSELIWEFEYLALLSRKHPLANQEILPYEELVQGIEITHGDHSVPYLSPKNLLQAEQKQRAQKRIYVYERGSQFDLLTQVPDTYMWVSPLRKITLEQYNLVQRSCTVNPGLSNVKYKDILIYPQGYQRTALDELFLECLFATRDEVSIELYK